MIAAVVCPHPPLLVEDFDRSGVPEMRDVRAAARAALADLVAQTPSAVVVLATGRVPSGLDEGAGGDLGPWGVPVSVGGSGRGLGLAHAVGAWLLDDAGWTGPRRYVDSLVDVGDDEAVLVMADGTTKRTLRAPGFLDERAEGFDAVVEDALRLGDVSGLAGLDLALGEELGAVDATSLVVLAEAARGKHVDATLHHASAPLGVGYWVASWGLSA